MTPLVFRQAYSKKKITLVTPRHTGRAQINVLDSNLKIKLETAPELKNLKFRLDQIANPDQRCC
jgi:hypothetical protein